MDSEEETLLKSERNELIETFLSPFPSDSHASDLFVCLFIAVSPSRTVPDTRTREKFGRYLLSLCCGVSLVRGQQAWHLPNLEGTPKYDLLASETGTGCDHKRPTGAKFAKSEPHV